MPRPHFLNCACQAGNFYCTWLDDRSNQTGSDIYIQRFDLAGNVYFDSLGLPVSTAQFDDAHWIERNSLQILPDGTGGAITAWTYLDLIYNGYSLLKAQRISSSGHIYWENNGKRLAGYFSSLSELGLYKMGGLFWVVSQGSTPRRYQQFDINGNTVYADTGRAFLNNIYASAMNQNKLYTMAAIDGAFRGSKRDTVWNEQWPNVPYIHTTWDDNANILPDGFGGMYVTMSDQRDWPTDWVILQRIYPNGHVGGDTLDVGITEDNPHLPENYLSLKAYPNPFNSNTTITISGIDNAEISIFDITGRQIVLLHAENGKAVWDASGYSSGYILHVYKANLKPNPLS